MVISIGLFQTVRLSKWYLHFDTPSTLTTCCDLLENSYLCGSNNNSRSLNSTSNNVVICLKIPTFVVATTTQLCDVPYEDWL